MARLTLKSPIKVCLTCGQLGRVLLLSLLPVMLQSCVSGGAAAPVSDRSSPVAAVKGGQHVVQKGETLYSIAWRYGIDYKELSRRNGISKGYIIYPGQIIYLDNTAEPVTARSKTTKAPSASSSRTQVAKTPTKKTTTPSREITTFTDFKWQWPARGRIIRNYSPKSGLNKGIDIDGRLGEPVLSAAPGTVVYSGDGLRGYGKLLIIKHNETFLSAYAHNSKLLAKEGEIVKGNQKIAEIGSSGTDIAKLHFEIRREGKPVDPLQYLPKR